jgi:hypothetical protein
MSYSLLFTREQVDKIKKLIYKTGSVTPEIEFRLGYITERGNFSSDNGENYFQTFIDKLYSNKAYNTVSIHKDIVYNKGELRKIVSTTTTYEEKIKSNYDITVVNDFVSNENATIRFSHAFETPKDKSEYDSSTKSFLERKRERTSFVFNKFNLDCTKVTQTNKNYTEYEIEAELHQNFVEELLSKGVKDSFKDLVTVIKQIFGIFFDNVHSLYSVDVYGGVKPLITNLYRNIEKAVRPKNIYIEEAQTGLKNYTITNKLDGVGYQFFILEEVTDGKKYYSFFLKNKVEVWKIGHVLEETKNLSSISNIIFDVEFFKYGLYVFDVVVSKDPTHKYTNKNLAERLEGAQRMIDMISPIIQKDAFLKQFKFYVKTFYNTGVFSNDIKLLFQDVTKTYGSQIVENNDGIIFQNIGPYNPKDPIYKWKFYSKITIDFLFEYKSSTLQNTTYKLKVVGPKEQFLTFKDPETKNDIEITVDNDKLFNNIKGSNLDGYVIEVGKDNNGLLIHRIRFDKNPTDANFITVANATWKDIINELTLGTVIREIDNAREQKVEKDNEETSEIIFDDKNTPTEYFPSIIPNPFRFSNVSVSNTVNVDQAEKTYEVMKLFYKDTDLKQMSILDLSSCIGGNTWKFIDKFLITYANELSPLQFKLLRNNMFAISSYNIYFLNMNPVDVMKKLIVDVVFTNPPWSGVDYKTNPKVGYYKDDKFYDIVDLLVEQEDFVRSLIVLRVPHKYEYKTPNFKRFKYTYRFTFVDVRNNSPVYDIIVFSVRDINKNEPSIWHQQRLKWDETNVNIFRVPYNTFKYKQISKKKEEKLDKELEVQETYARKVRGEFIITELEKPEDESVNQGVMLDNSEATLLKNFIFFNCIAYGNKQEYFNLDNESNVIIIGDTLGTISIVFSPIFKQIDTKVDSKQSLEKTKNILEQNNITNVNATLTVDSADIIFIDLLTSKVAENKILSYANRCKLLVIRFNSSTSKKRFEELFGDVEYMISEIINNFRFVAIFPTSPYEISQEVTILRNCMEIFRKEYNNYKRTLITKYCNKKTILDIGFGRGGDINKYVKANIKKIFGIEPNQEFITSFNERASDKVKDLIDKQIFILKTGGQDTDNILNFISEHNNEKTKVDVVTMMFSLSFFYRSKEDLSALAKTIGKSLKDDGVFIGGFMDGRKLEDLLVFGNNIITPCYEIKNIDVTLDKKFGQKIIFNMRDSQTATTQEEYLIYLEELEKELAVYDIYLEKYITSPEVIDYSLLTQDESYLANFYSFFVFKKRYDNIVEYPTLSPLILNGENLIRLPSNPDGNCYFNSVLIALNQTLATTDNVINLRKHLAANYTVEEYEKHFISLIKLQGKLMEVLSLDNECSNSLFKGWEKDKKTDFLNYVIRTYNPSKFEGYMETIEEVFVKAGLDRELSREIIRGCHYNSYLSNLNNLESESKWPFEEFYKYVAEQLNINVYFITNRVKKLVTYGTTDVKDNGKINIILINNDNMHFEPLAKYIDNKYITTFTVDEVKSFL